MQILVVDDQPEWYQRYRNELSGHFIQGAMDAETARAHLEEKDYDAIIMDGFLGGTREPDTLNFIRELREQGYKGPIFAASADRDMQKRQIEAGCNSCLFKSRPESWSSVVNSYFSK